MMWNLKKYFSIFDALSILEKVELRTIHMDSNEHSLFDQKYIYFANVSINTTEY